MKLFWSIVWAVCMVGSVQAQVLEATVDNPQLPFGEAFNLNISYTGSDGDALQPDLSVLQNDFTIYSTSSSTQISFINGQQSRRQDWDIGLLPKREGKITIPAIQAGKYQTKPLDVEVLAAGVKPNVSGEKVQNDNKLAQSAKFSAELVVDEKEPYLQQQVNAVLTIYDAGGLQLTEEPKFMQSDNWIVKTLQQPTVAAGKENTREIKFYYALFPQKSGRLEIPTVNVNGYYLSFEQNKNNPLLSARNFGGIFQMLDFDFDNMFGMQKPVSLFTKPLEINVKPAVSGYGNNWWLPASSLSMTSRWTDGKPQFKVGETVAREIILTAAGVVDSQLPEPEFVESPDFKQYPEKPQLNMTVNDKEMIAQSVIRVVYIPQRAGEVMLPEIRIPWFNTVTNKMETAVVPSEKIAVEKSDAVAPVPAAETVVLAAEPDDIREDFKQQQAKSSAAETPWGWIVLLVMAAFIFGLVISYLLFHQVPRIEGNKSADGWLNDIRRNLKQKDYRVLRDNLLKWGNAVFKENSILNLNDLAAVVDNQEFTRQIQKLNAILYGSTSENVDEVKLLETLKSVGRKDRNKQTDKPLPNLYK